MKASELVARLQELMAEHGDLDVAYCGDPGGTKYTPESVEIYRKRKERDSWGYNSAGVCEPLPEAIIYIE